MSTIQIALVVSPEARRALAALGFPVDDGGGGEIVDLRLGAIVLCGGESRRMGEPKAWLPFGPERMLPRVVRLVREVAGEVVVVSAPGQALPELPEGVVIVRDEVAGRGPLQGLATGLAALPSTAELVYATATDAPFLRPALIRKLVELVGESDVAIPKSGGRHHPLAGVYRRAAVLAAASSLLREGRFRLSFLTEMLPTRVVEGEELAEADPGLGSLRNLNTPDDYRAALSDAFPDAGG